MQGCAKDRRKYSNEIRKTTAYKTRTVKETLDVFNDPMLSGPNQHVLGGSQADGCQQNPEACKIATHVVTGVTTGADVYLMFSGCHESADEKKRLNIYMNLLIDMKKMNLTADLNFTKNDEDFDERRSTAVKIISDIDLVSIDSLAHI